VSHPIVDLFPPSAAVDGAGHLTVGGCDTLELAERFGTSQFVVDEGTLRARAQEYLEAAASRWSGPTEVAFASKAFPAVPVYRVFAEAGTGCDVASAGELAMALRAGFAPSRILVHGNAKSDEDVRAAVDAGVRWIVVDNLDDIRRIEAMASGVQHVLLRVIPEVDAPTHDDIATGGADSKFGLSLEHAEEAIALMQRSSRIHLDGIHCHVGSQILETDPFRQSVEAVATLGEFEVYDMGGGLGVRYSYDDRPPEVGEYLDVLLAAAAERLPTGATVVLEPGRSLVARAGCTLYRVQTVKRGHGPTFVAVDGGMGDNLEVSIYGIRFEATIADRVTGLGEQCHLVGHHCESGDRLVDGLPLDEPAVGDVVAVPATGAYCYTMSNNYNGYRRPPVVFVDDGHARLVVRRETHDDLWRRDV
jgi:diaminopimelate decarboxylase